MGFRSSAFFLGSFGPVSRKETASEALDLAAIELIPLPQIVKGIFRGLGGEGFRRTETEGL
jgi:hypothetical protein